MTSEPARAPSFCFTLCAWASCFCCPLTVIFAFDMFFFRMEGTPTVVTIALSPIKDGLCHSKEMVVMGDMYRYRK